MNQLIQITREWEGQSCAIFASGPSMSTEIAEQCRGMRCIAINNQSFDCAPWAEVIYGSDGKWWREYWPRIKELPGRKLSLMLGGLVDGVQYLRASREVFDDRPSHLSTGGNSGYAALCLAAKLGASQVFLYGYDMRARNGRTRRHDYPPRLNSAPRFNHWIPNFQKLAPELSKRGVNVINCTPGSALTCFPFRSDSKAA